MPCGSPNCTSSLALDAAVLSFPDIRSYWKTPLAWLVAIARWWERRFQYRQLLELDDRMLDDVGMSRTSIEEMRGASLYERAWQENR